jgi:hypothetical protein
MRGIDHNSDHRRWVLTADPLRPRSVGSAVRTDGLAVGEARPEPENAVIFAPTP